MTTQNGSDLSGEIDPTELMIQRQEEAESASQQAHNERNTDFTGEETTEGFSVEEAISNLKWSVL